MEMKGRWRFRRQESGETLEEQIWVGDQQRDLERGEAAAGNASA